MIRDIYAFMAGVADIDADDVDFLEYASNVYRTEEFIVKQHISSFTDKDVRTLLMSEDTYYYRTEERDEIYEEIFPTEGKRIHTAMFSRTYIE